MKKQTNKQKNLHTQIKWPKSVNRFIKGSQLAQMKKSIPDMSCHEIYRDEGSWSKKYKHTWKNYDICEFVEFGAIWWKFDILSITA